MRPSPAAHDRAIRDMLRDGHSPRSVASLTGVSLADVSAIEGDMVRDCLAGTGTAMRPRPPAPKHTSGSGRNGLAMKALTDAAQRAAEHARRCRRLGPLPCEAELEALKAKYLATRPVTLCPPGHAHLDGMLWPTPTARPRAA